MEQILTLKDANELYDFMKQKISYGFVDSEGMVHRDMVPTKNDTYYINEPSTTIQKCCGL